MHGKLCVVTGANSGIGLETARGLARAGATVVLACRDVAKGERARDDIVQGTGNDAVSVLPLDLADKAAVRAFAGALRERHARIDVLVNNAGVVRRTRSATKDGFESTFGVNHIGTARVTLELLDLLRAGAPSRVVFVTSKLHRKATMRWDDLQFERGRLRGMEAYNHSKLASLLFAKALARRLAGDGVAVNGAHPGVVGTELTREYPRLVMRIAKIFLLTPTQGAACPLHVATAPELDGVTGEYFEESKRSRASDEACDAAVQDRLWSITEQMLGA